MFTLQSAQIETALRGAGVPDLSAKEMMQGVANCQAPLEHRGPVAFTHQPRDNSELFVVPIAEGSPDVYAPPSVYLQPQFSNQFVSPVTNNFTNNVSSRHVSVNINIPPWQNIPWEPIPYPDHPDWQPIPFPDLNFPPLLFNDPAVMAGGPVQAGPVSTPSVEAGKVRSGESVNEGDFINGNQIVNYGPAVFNGPTRHNHNVVNNNVINNNVVNRGPVVNKNIVHNRHVHNHRGVNHGRQRDFGPRTFYGEAQFGGTAWFDGDVYVGNSSAMSPQTYTLVTDVEWTGSELRKKTRSVTFLGHVEPESTATVVAGVSCPTQPVSGPASNFVDSP